MLQRNWMQSLLWNVNTLFLLTQWRHRVEENRTVVFMWESTLQLHGLASPNPCCEHCNFLFGYFFCHNKTSKKTKKNVHTALSYMSVIKLQTYSVTFSFKEETHSLNDSFRAIGKHFLFPQLLDILAIFSLQVILDTHC